MMQFFLLLTAIVISGFAILPLLMKFLYPRYSIGFVCILSLPAGWAFFTIMLFLMNLFFSVSIGLFSGFIALLFIFLCSLLLRRVHRNFLVNTEVFSGEKTNYDTNSPIAELQPPCRRFFCFFLCIIALIFWLGIGFLAMGSPVDDIPGFGVWGYKSLLIYDTGAIPFDVIADSGSPYLHADYPMGYPILLAWCQFAMMEFNDQLIKLLPFLSAVLVFLLFIVICIHLGVGLNFSLLFALLVSSAGSFVLCATSMYADILLLLYVLPGVFLIFRHLTTEGGLAEL
ncbi:MAG TPA: hypothetical protein PLJ44_01750 [Victivallales bacterium]|nr:hypothetical protein [Victivallales bacterium]